MSKIRLAKHIIFISFSATLFIFSLVMYILSKTDSGVYNWTLSNGKEFYEQDISFNMDFVIGILVSLTLIMFGIYNFIQDKKNLDNKKGIAVTITIIPLLISSYSLSTFFKALVKASVKHKEFVYSLYQSYLYIGIIALVFLAYSILYIIEYRKESQKGSN